MINSLLLQFSVAVIAIFAQDSYESSCPYPVPPKHAVLSAQSYLDEFNFNGFQAYQRVDFICRVGYRQTKGAMWSICGVSGRWYPDTRKAGECARELRTGEIECKGQFRCRKDLQCIDRKLRCDCKSDCRDGTDEIGCKNPKQFVFVNPAGRKKSGVLTSPNYPLGYVKSQFECHFIFYTDPSYRIKLSFEDFSLREKKGEVCVDFIKISGAHDTYKNLKKAEGDSGLHFHRTKQSIVSCGDRSFGVVVSNNSQLDMVVRLSGKAVSTVDSKLKGYALSWSIISQSDAVEIVEKMSERMAQFHTRSTTHLKRTRKSGGDSLLTILLPVAISALLPVSMLLFLCYHIRANRAKNSREEHEGKDATEAIRKGCDEGEVSASNNEYSSLPLMALKARVVDSPECTATREDESESKGSWEDDVNQGCNLQAFPTTGLRYMSAAKSIEEDFTSVELDTRSATGRISRSEGKCASKSRKSKRHSASNTVESDTASGQRRWPDGLLARTYGGNDVVKKSRKSKRYSVARTHEDDNTSEIRSIELSSGDCGRVYSCDVDEGAEKRRKYLEKGLRPLLNGRVERRGDLANRKAAVCTCNGNGNRQTEIERNLQSNHEFDTDNGMQTDDKHEQRSLAETSDARKNFCQATFNDFHVHEVGRKHRSKKGRRENSEKWHRSHERIISEMGKTRSVFNPIDIRPPQSYTVDYCYQGCSMCKDWGSLPPSHVPLGHHEITEPDGRMQGSNRSESSDSGTCTGSEAPRKWLHQSNATCLSVSSQLKCRSDTDSGSRESAYAESSEDCAKYQYREQRMTENGGKSFLRYDEYTPPQHSYSYYGNQDASLTLDERWYGNGDVMETMSNARISHQTEAGFFPTSDDYIGSSLRNEGCKQTRLYSDKKYANNSTGPFEGSRQSNEGLVYSYNTNYVADCQCRACFHV